MKVKEVAEFLKVTTEELLKLLKNVSVGKSYTVDSEIEIDLEKKLAKRYGVPYPFKSKPKAPAKPAQPEAKAPVKAQPKAEPAKDAKQGGQKQAPKQNAQPAKENKQNGQKQAPKAEPQKQNKPRPSDIPSYKDEIVETVVDEEFLDKYDEFLQDNQYQNGQNTKIKQKVRTNEKVNKKPKQQKSRAEKLAGSIEQKKEDHVLYYDLNMTEMDVADADAAAVFT